MILFDTETTGLTLPDAAALDRQPRIIEFCAVRLNDKTLKEEATLELLINPGIPITPEITRITGLKEDDLRGKSPFIAHWEEIAKFFLGQTMSVAHNHDFDSKLLIYDLRRIGKEHNFPWPMRRLCTVEASYSILNRRMKLTELHIMATGGQEIKGAHRAINDVRAMAVCLRWLKEQGRVKL